MPANTEFAERSLIVGNPARRIKEVSDKMYNHKVEGTELYRKLPSNMHLMSQEVEPLSEIPENRIEDFPDFDTWMKLNNKVLRHITEKHFNFYLNNHKVYLI